MIEGRKAWICTSAIDRDNAITCGTPSDGPVISGCGTEMCVEGRFFTLDELATLLAANVEAGLLELSTMISVYRAEGADAEDLPGLEEVERFISVLIAKTTPNLAALTSRLEKMAEGLEELANTLDHHQSRGSNIGDSGLIGAKRRAKVLLAADKEGGEG